MYPSCLSVVLQKINKIEMIGSSYRMQQVVGGRVRYIMRYATSGLGYFKRRVSAKIEYCELKDPAIFVRNVHFLVAAAWDSSQ